MKKTSPKAYARALYELTLDKRGAELEKILEQFVAHLASAQILKQADKITAEFIAYAKAQEGIVDIAITSSHELPSATLSHIKKAFGEKVEATAAIDESLLGGVVIKTKDKILDGSLRTQLNNLKMKLAS